MCLSESPCLEIEHLHCLRLYRAGRAGRVLQNALREQRRLDLQVELARTELEQSRQYENHQRSVLLARFQGQVVCPRGLSGWVEDERKVSARTARQASALQSLLEQQRLAASHVERARLCTSECQRKVEKLRQFSRLLAEEGQWPVHRE